MHVERTHTTHHCLLPRRPCCWAITSSRRAAEPRAARSRSSPLGRRHRAVERDPTDEPRRPAYAAAGVRRVALRGHRGRRRPRARQAGRQAAPLRHRVRRQSACVPHVPQGHLHNAPLARTCQGRQEAYPQGGMLYLSIIHAPTLARTTAHDTRTTHTASVNFVPIVDR